MEQRNRSSSRSSYRNRSSRTSRTSRSSDGGSTQLEQPQLEAAQPQDASAGFAQQLGAAAQQLGAAAQQDAAGAAHDGAAQQDGAANRSSSRSSYCSRSSDAGRRTDRNGGCSSTNRSSSNRSCSRNRNSGPRTAARFASRLGSSSGRQRSSSGAPRSSLWRPHSRSFHSTTERQRSCRIRYNSGPACGRAIRRRSSGRISLRKNYAPSTRFHFIEQPLLLVVEPRAFANPALLAACPQTSRRAKSVVRTEGQARSRPWMLEEPGRDEVLGGVVGWKTRNSNDVVRQGRRTNPWSE